MPHQIPNRIQGENLSQLGFSLFDTMDSSSSGPFDSRLVNSVRLACDLWLAQRAKLPGALFQPGTRNF